MTIPSIANRKSGKDQNGCTSPPVEFKLRRWVDDTIIFGSAATKIRSAERSQESKA